MSFAEMESKEAEVSMDLDPTRTPRRKERIDMINGIFLSCVHFLNQDLSKCVIVGVFKNRGDGLGVLFKGRKGHVYWSLDSFNQFSAHFSEIRDALDNQTRFHCRLDNGDDIRVKRVFGKSCAFLYDGEHTLSLDRNDWSQFLNNLPVVSRVINELFYNELLIQEYIRNILNGPEDVLKPENLPSPIADRLLDELRRYKSKYGGDS